MYMIALSACTPVCSELNSQYLTEQTVLLAAEPSLQPTSVVLFIRQNKPSFKEGRRHEKRRGNRAKKWKEG